MIAINASINLYAQLAKLAEIRPKQDRLRLSAGAPSPSLHISYEQKSSVFFQRNCGYRNQVQKSTDKAS